MTGLSNIIAEEIRQNGPISMTRFMDLALYCPVYGYYERGTDSIGRSGDFHTNVSVGAVFGELLAVQFADWSGQLTKTRAGRLHWIEAGAHDGQLAHDILSWLNRSRPDLMERTTYRIVEPSPHRQSIQASRLADFRDAVNWVVSLSELRTHTGGVEGIVFSNELLDAQPVSRYVWDAGCRCWCECLVDLRRDAFVWTRGERVSESAHAVLDTIAPRELRAMLPDGYVIDYAERATQWWQDAARSIDQGWLVTIDYGFDAAGAVLPTRTGGTLRGYRRHRIVEDVLKSPGLIDITAHVHFDQIQQAGEACGAQTEYFGTQESFLVDVFSRAQQSSPPKLTVDVGRLRQFKTLIHPNHFGHSFHVLVQSVAAA